MRKTQDMEAAQLAQFARHLVTWRERRGFSVQALSDVAGVPSNLIEAVEEGAVEAGDNFPMRYVFALALALRVDPARLFRG